MRKIILFLLVILSAAGLEAFTLLDSGFQARAQGLGNAFTGLCDDASALYYNPALIYDVPKHQVMLGYGRTFSMADHLNFSWTLPGLRYPSFFFKNPKPEFGISLGMSTLLDEGITSTSEPSLGSPGDYIKGSDYDYYEHLFMLGFGTRIKNFWMMRFSAGFNLKYSLRKFADFESSGFGADFGINATHKYFNFGVVLKNIFTGITSEGSTEALPLTLRFGTLLRIQRIFKNIFKPKEEMPGAGKFNIPSEYLNYTFNPVIDAEFVFEDTARFNLFTGLEAWLNELLSLRFGYNTLSGLSFGGSVQIVRIRLDYAYQVHPELDATHRISGTFYF